MKLFRILLILALFVAIATVTSCNVTRKTTTESAYYQKGDTAIQIVTKTIETYDASKK